MSKYMQLALQQATIALQSDEVPIGAVIVHNDKVIGVGYNNRNSSHDATNHAEMIAIRQACQALGDWRLEDCSMYVTLQPCLMCLGACYNARLSAVYFGAYDTNDSNKDTHLLSTANTVNHVLHIEGGLLEEQCSAIIKQYFADKRKRKL